MILENNAWKETEVKFNDQVDNYGKCIACQSRGMPQKDSEFVQFKIQDFVYQVKSLGINHLIQTGTSHFPNSLAARF